MNAIEKTDSRHRILIWPVYVRKNVHLKKILSDKVKQKRRKRETFKKRRK
jgi:hypothetical protein